MATGFPNSNYKNSIVSDIFFNLCDTQFDCAFEKIELLDRYPWVGCNFAGSKCRPLIIGDSHYATDDNGVFSQDVLEWFQDKKSTRWIVDSMINDKCKGELSHPMFEGLLKTFIKITPENVKDFWSNVAFYNFIQRIMQSSSERPTTKDKVCGWNCLGDIVRVLHPTSILIIGVRNWYGIDEIDKIEEMHINGWFWDKSHKISRTVPGTATITFYNETIPITIIHHTSQGYNAAAWREYLTQTDNHMMSYLSNQ